MDLKMNFKMDKDILDVQLFYIAVQKITKLKNSLIFTRADVDVLHRLIENITAPDMKNTLKRMLAFTERREPDEEANLVGALVYGALMIDTSSHVKFAEEVDALMDVIASIDVKEETYRLIAKLMAPLYSSDFEATLEIMNNKKRDMAH
jgi:hypothetical protein